MSIRNKDWYAADYQRLDEENEALKADIDRLRAENEELKRWKENELRKKKLPPWDTEQ